MKSKPLLTASLIFAMFFSASSQEKSITGTVNSVSEDSSIPGVNIIEKGTLNGTITDPDGKFSITVASSESVLQFTYVGMETQEILVGNQSSIDVSMIDDITQLSEVIVTGYGEREKRSYTGSISQLDNSRIENRPVNTIDQVLQGAVPGLQLGATSGTPGSVQDIRIRGISSITASNSPLFVIDG